MDNLTVTFDKLFLLPLNAYAATNDLTELLLNKIWPLIIHTRNKISSYNDERGDRIHDMFHLCCSQIKKCIVNLYDIFKSEYRLKVILEGTRHSVLDRLSWCLNRLKLIHGLPEHDIHEDADTSFLSTPMYFVSWIDNSLDLLLNLSTIIYRTDYKSTHNSYEAWKDEILETVHNLHSTIDELLLSAMTLCKYCLPDDQNIVKARCQVVLREAKALLDELLTENNDGVYKINKDSLKLPINPSNVNVQAEVLKDALYALETNTNTALLSLLVYCFSYTITPVEILRGHFKGHLSDGCLCNVKDSDNIVETCLFVKEFDVHNERLLQIGTFAVSCSTDQKRILGLRSSLASLEALDSHLVPAMVMDPTSMHADFLAKQWCQEVDEIRDSVFLIVDPSAFSEKCYQLLHEKLLNILDESSYNNSVICAAINIGVVINDFFQVYIKYEPYALISLDKLLPLLADLSKVQKECKVVSNILASPGDTIYEMGTLENASKKEVTFDQLKKRLKLLYTIIGRINKHLQPNVIEDNYFAQEIGEEKPRHVIKDATHTVVRHINETFINTGKKPVNNTTGSIFARTDARTPKNFPLSRLTKNLKLKNDELSFSVRLDELLGMNQTRKMEEKNSTSVVTHKLLDSVKERSVFYNTPRKNRSSLRKAVLNRNYQLPSSTTKLDVTRSFSLDGASDNVELLQGNMSLQITEILDQMTNMSSVVQSNATATENKATCSSTKDDKNILSLNINNDNTMSKRIWNIPVNGSAVETDFNCTSLTNNSGASNQPSCVSTLERMNDLKLVEDRLSNLRKLHKETIL